MNNLVSKNAFENLSGNLSIGSTYMLYSKSDDFLLKNDFKTIIEIQEITKVYLNVFFEFYIITLDCIVKQLKPFKGKTSNYAWYN